ncbi:hypothetical protein ACWC0C_43445 [Streptomyces sp. NPDC001709]
MKFLLTRAKGSTQALADRLGVSRRTVERYRAAEAVTESYFTEWGTWADGLRGDSTHVQSIDFQF